MQNLDGDGGFQLTSSGHGINMQKQIFMTASRCCQSMNDVTDMDWFSNM